MVVCESTFAGTEAGLAREYGHLTAGQAGRIAAESGARLLVLTHFSQRYEHDDGQRLAAEAATAFGRPVVLAHDLGPDPGAIPSARVLTTALLFPGISVPRWEGYHQVQTPEVSRLGAKYPRWGFAVSANSPGCE
jgi:hypothetical protein